MSLKKDHFLNEKINLTKSNLVQEELDDLQSLKALAELSRAKEHCQEYIDELVVLNFSYNNQSVNKWVQEIYEQINAARSETELDEIQVSMEAILNKIVSNNVVDQAKKVCETFLHGIEKCAKNDTNMNEFIIEKRQVIAQTQNEAEITTITKDLYQVLERMQISTMSNNQRFKTEFHNIKSSQDELKNESDGYSFEP
ncbi:hypothetical protein [Legionella rowbothamii]|uniref:hypothetical protein n=1 Tax=Legionella rowbothamii TaxID=96229 RepID=UPI001054C43F|nr:hypothetical protein [Legionella rowbothamii]